MTATYILRRAKPGDLDALLELEQTAFDTDHLSRRQYRRHIGNPNAAVLVAAGADGLLGKALVFFNARHDIARLYSIAVGHNARGQGLGAVLLLMVEKEARRRGCTRMRLEVSTKNTAAMHLYERHGYRRIGERPGYYENGDDAFRYEKDLKAPAR